VLDHCRAIHYVIKEGKKNEIYNIGSGFETSNNNLVKTIAQIMGADIDLLEYVEDRKGHDFRYSLNSSKLIQMGFKFENHFMSNLKKTIEWYLENPEWWASKEKFNG